MLFEREKIEILISYKMFFKQNSLFRFNMVLNHRLLETIEGCKYGIRLNQNLVSLILIFPNLDNLILI